MKKWKKILSLLLAVVTLCSAFAVFTVSVSAAEETTTAEAEDKSTVDYLNQVFATPEDKLATMKLKLTKGNYQIYCDEVSGEVAVKNTVTGQILSTNPYDVGVSTSSDSIKYQTLSQIIIKYTDNGKEKEFSSYEYASLRNQITVKNIKNGIRVEYIIGREEARRLVPRCIEDSRFQEKILAPMLEAYDNNPDNFFYKKFLAYYGGPSGMKSLETCATDRLKEDLLASFPVTAKMNIWVFDPTASDTEIEKVEEMIKSACSEYSYEEMDYDHQLTEYEGTDTNPPVFKMALEYTLDDDGFTVRLPVNGLTFNESLYQLTNISILPYMGCGNNAYDGYVFYPDGSGTLFSLQDLADTNTTSVSSKVYGADYAYHQITGTYQQTVRYPTFGIVESTQYYECDQYDDNTGEIKTSTISGLIYDKVMEAQKDGSTLPTAYSSYNTIISSASEIRPVTVNRGFAAIVQEGDALTNLVYYHSGVLSPYDTVMMNFNPRPQDSYNLADSISVGDNKEWTVITDRKYTGNFKVHYVMLTDKNVATEKMAEGTLDPGSWYEASWLGMAMAYRGYLVNSGVLSPLTEADTSGDIPLYIESFGSLETVEKIASIPVSVKRALTSAADVITMYEDLSSKGVSNINFKLTGFANGGMYCAMPYRLKWEKSVSKETSMQELFDYAADVEDGQLGLFPEFEFSYAYRWENSILDGLSVRKHAVKTIDDRYTFKRQYSATQQKYTSIGLMALSPAYFSHFYEKFMPKYLAYDNVTGISVGSLGNALNSDFDEDEPYNREDAKTFVKRALSYLSSQKDGQLEVMVSGGNVYTWQYVNHILGVALDSSRYIKASYSVPFIGVVLHGYMNFAGTPLNMEGDINYAKLKAIENGASLYFTLSYSNTDLLKEYSWLSQYYSIRYDIWQDDLVEIYNEVNGVLKDVQTKLIVDHQFLSGMRVPDTNELTNDIMEEYDKILDFYNNQEEYERKQKNEAVADARKNVASVLTAAENFISGCLMHYSSISGAAYLYTSGDRSFENRLAAYVEANAAYEKMKAEYDAASDEEKAAMATLMTSAEATQRQSLAQVRTYVRNISRAIYALETEYNTLSQLLEDAESGRLLLNSTENIPQSILIEVEEQLASTKALMQEQLGVNFNLAVEKAEVDTFLRTHVSNIIFACYGENTVSQIGTIGKGLKLYEMLANKTYGLATYDYLSLRLLPANQDLTDAELQAKYGFTDTTPSITGLVMFVREMLGDGYTFDPTLDDTVKDAEGLTEVDRNILGYFLGMLFNSVNKLTDTSTVPALNFSPTRINESGKVVAATTNINKLTISINNVINKKLIPLLNGVTDGNYHFEAVVSDSLMEDTVSEIVKLIKAAEPVKADPNVLYLTPDTMEQDVRNYVVGKYYQAVVSLCQPEGIVDTLNVITVTTKTNVSLSNLAANRLLAYGQTDGYKAVLDAMLTDTVVSDKLDIVADKVKDAYGDVRADIEKAYAKAFAAAVLADTKTPTFDFKDEGMSNSDKTALNEQLYAATTEALANAGADDLAGIIAGLAAELKTHTFADSVDVDAEAASFVSYLYLVKLSAAETVNYYYDSQMAGMDAAVRAAVSAKHSEILTQIDEGTTSVQVYDMILAMLGATENFSGDYASVTDFVKAVASEVTYHINGSYSMSSDVQSYFIYRMFESFSDYSLGDVPTLTIYDGDKIAAPGSTKYKNAIKYFDKDFVQARVTTLINAAKNNTARGRIPDYSLSKQMTEEELDAWTMSVYEKLKAGQYLTDAQEAEGEAKDALCAEIAEYIRYQYYAAVLDKLDASKEPSFHVSEIYGDDLYTACENLKALLRYYTVNLTTLTEEDIDKMVTSATIATDDEVEDPSKYLSADGRIVAVTYGDQKSDGTYEGYKTFLLNYNNFSVSVVYDEITYTIPAFGYVVITY